MEPRKEDEYKVCMYICGGRSMGREELLETTIL